MEQSNNLDKDPLNVDLGDPPEEWSKWFAYMGLKVRMMSKYIFASLHYLELCLMLFFAVIDACRASS